MFNSWIRNFLTTLRGNSANLLVRIEIAVSLHVRESKTVLDSGFHAVDSGFQLLDSTSFSVELGFRIPNLYSGLEGPGFQIPQAKRFLDSGFQVQKFAGLRNPDTLPWGEHLRIWVLDSADLRKEINMITILRLHT